MRIQLPKPVSSGVIYEAIEIDGVRVEDGMQSYVANIYGVAGGKVVPLILLTAEGVEKIETAKITFAEIEMAMQSNAGATIQEAATIAMAQKIAGVGV